MLRRSHVTVVAAGLGLTAAGPVFADGFEDGATMAWSASSP